jgi:hypothetical protein
MILRCRMAIFGLPDCESRRDAAPSARTQSHQDTNRFKARHRALDQLALVRPGGPTGGMVLAKLGRAAWRS